MNKKEKIEKTQQQKDKEKADKLMMKNTRNPKKKYVWSKKGA